jgi:1-acyl-sn-glycerol-3-phosphate acyltransferase
MRFRDAALDWAATAASVGGVLTTLVTFDAVQRVAIRFGPHAHQRAVSHMARWMNRSALLSGTRYEVEGREHLTPGQSYIVVMNHQSLLDIAMASDFLEPLEPRYVSKIEIARGIPGVSYNLTRGGSACIDRGDSGQALSAIADLARRAKAEGFSVVIFPEGTRSKTGAMKPFRPAGLATLVKHAPGFPVLPVTSSGGSFLFRHNLRPIERNVTLGFRIHAPVTPPDPDDTAAFTAFLRALETTIAGALPPGDAQGDALTRPSA